MKRASVARHGSWWRVSAVVATAAMAMAGTVASPVSSAFAAPTTNQPQPKNVALHSNGATATTSGNETDNWTVDNLIDGVINPDATGAEASRWSSNHADDAWAKITFSAPTQLDHVNLVWEAACAAKWDLQASTDGEHFENLKSVDDQQCPEAGETLKTVVKLDAEHAAKQYTAIKVQVRERTPIKGTKWGASLWEVEAWNMPEAEPTPAPEKSTTALVPLPVHINDSLNQEPYVLAPTASIVASQSLQNEAELLANNLRASTGYQLPIVQEGKAGDIVLTTGSVEGQSGDEAYSLNVSKDGVKIVGQTAHGVFNGTQTLRQLLPSFAQMNRPVLGNWSIPATQISDSPRFEYRGMMLDIARSFIPADDIKKMIDTLSFYKISVLHLHLADDQGWRIEITNDGREADDDIDYTLLTKVSGRTAMAAHEKQASGEIGRTGFLTQQEYKELQAYAKARHIELIPEIDVPGHTTGAMHAIPQLNTPGSYYLGTKQQPTVPANSSGAVGYSYLDPNSEATMHFVKHVFGQIAAITDSKYIHIGGDEPHQFNHRYGQDAYNQFLGKVVDVIHGLNKQAVGWNEVAQAPSIREGDVMQYWVGDLAPTKAAIQNKKAKILVSKGNASYLDQKYSGKTPLALNWACQGACDFPHYYNWNPAQFVGVTDDHIIGNEAPLWSETVRGLDQAEFLTFMRTLSHAEIGWTPQMSRNVEDFKARVAHMGMDLNAMGVNFYDGPATTWQADLVGVSSTAPTADANVQLGYLSAPGTKVAEDGKTVMADRVDDADGTSKSVLGDGQKVMIDWGDGSPEEAATVTSTRPRDAYHAAGMYVLTAKHTFQTAGKHTVTLKLGDRTAKAEVTAKQGGAQAAPLFTPFVPQGDAALTLDESSTHPTARLGMKISNFIPGEFADVKLDDKINLGQIRPEKDGSLHQYVFIPAGVPAGLYKLTVTQGDRTASADVAIWTDGSANPLANAISGVTLAGADSEETQGEQPPNGPAAAALDGDPSSFWHTKWQGSQPNFPHWISMNLNQTCRVSQLEYTPRQNGQNGRIKDYEIYVSTDGENWGQPVASDSFDGSKNPKVVTFDAHEGSFVKLKGLNSQAGNQFGGAGEIRIGGLCGDQQPTSASVMAGGQTTAISDDGSTVVKASGHSVKVQLHNLKNQGRTSVWIGEDHRFFTQVDTKPGKLTEFDLTNIPNTEGDTLITLVTPDGRYSFHLSMAKLYMARASVPVYWPANDVNPALNPFAGEIAALMNARISNGWPDGTFRPLNQVDRLTMAAFLYRMAGSPDVKVDAPLFSDVSMNMVFWREIQWMGESGISTGWEDGTFRPHDPVSREAMAAFLYRFCLKFGDKCAAAVNPSQFEANHVSHFKDVPQGAPFAKEIAWMANAKISTGWEDGSFRPHDSMSREAMAAFIYRMMNNYVK